MSSMTYRPDGANRSRASSRKRYFPDQVSAKMKSKCCPRRDCRNSSPSAQTTDRRGSSPKCRFKMDNRASSLSTVVRCDPESMPSSSHAVDKPVPEPSSRKRADGLDAANVRNKEQVSGSDAIVKPEARVSAQMAGRVLGSLRLERSFIFLESSNDDVEKVFSSAHRA